MRTGNRLLRWIAMLTAVLMLAAACGDDGGSDTDEPGSDDPTSDDATDGDTTDDDMTDDMTDDDMTDDDMTDDDMTDDTTDDDTGDGEGAAGTFDCAEVQAAIDSATEFSTLDPTGSGEEDLEASFNQSRAALAALGEAAPEISAEVAQALEGLDALGAAFAELDWNTDFSTNPQAGLQLATLMGQADVIGMIGAMQSIGLWFASNCANS